MEKESIIDVNSKILNSSGMINNKLFLLPVIVLIIFLSCDNSRVYENNKRINDHEWYKNDTLTFLCNIADSSKYYDLLINIRTGGLYEYSNLFIFITIEAPSGKQIHEKLEITLADDNGKWLGKGLGDIKSISVPYRTRVQFGLPGIYKFEFVQGMRNEALDYVYDVGLRIQNSLN